MRKTDSGYVLTTSYYSYIRTTMPTSQKNLVVHGIKWVSENNLSTLGIFLEIEGVLVERLSKV